MWGCSPHTRGRGTPAPSIRKEKMRADALLGSFGREDAKQSRVQRRRYTSTVLPEVALTGTKSRILFFLSLGAGVTPAAGAGWAAPLSESAPISDFRSRNPS